MKEKLRPRSKISSKNSMQTFPMTAQRHGIPAAQKAAFYILPLRGQELGSPCREDDISPVLRNRYPRPSFLGFVWAVVEWVGGGRDEEWEEEEFGFVFGRD